MAILAFLQFAQGRIRRMSVFGCLLGLTMGTALSQAEGADGDPNAPRKPDAKPDDHAMVAMTDGARLSTDLYFPKGEGPWPVILQRTPYQRVSGRVPADLGYASVVQSTRGRFDSEGVSGSFADDGWAGPRDGYDTVEWIVAQPWCDGKVGTLGGSALGITQNMLAPTHPKGLLCQMIGKASCCSYLDASYNGGVFHQALAAGWLTGNHFPPEVLQRLLDHPYYDEVHKSVDCSTQFANVAVPTFQVAGWYDVFIDGNIRSFSGLQYQGGEGARGKQKIVIGPWIHPGDVKGAYPANSTPTAARVSERQMQWFAHYLKGEANGVEKWPAVTYYLMGAMGEEGAPGNEWRTSDVWPIPNEPTSLYLGADKALVRAAPAGEEQRLEYQYDPRHPVPTKGGTNLNIDKGPFDQREVENRPDVLLFTTEPLKEPVQIAGAVKALLWVATSAKDTDFTAKLADVYPDGRSMLVCDGVRRLSLRDGFTTPEFPEAGKAYEVEVQMQHTAIAFAPGHRIRLAISSSNSPRFEPNGNNGQPHLDQAEPVVAHNAVFLGTQKPSRLVLPVLKESGDKKEVAQARG
ncbi:MAG: CocE/NonD family hydrolase [Candidatus Sumerlaeota bacterium]|nr:CocE/NonD family hydrolase [Candidatus Sumerlaeota bacterium]